MGLVDAIRRLFSSSERDDEAAEREEYGVPDVGEASLRSQPLPGPASAGGAHTAEDELDSFRAPPDPDP